jgi:hypothetical protein
MQPVRTPQRFEIVLARETVDLVDGEEAVRTHEVGEHHDTKRLLGFLVLSHVVLLFVMSSRVASKGDVAIPGIPAK